MMGSNEVMVSIVTVSYNCIDNLRLALPLLKAQSYSCIEHIIVDGGSTDGSLEYIKEFADEFEKSREAGCRSCRWISEPDNGIYDAINKGIRMSSGSIIGLYWDMYNDDNVITDIVNAIRADGTDGAHGDLLYVDEHGKTVRKWKVGKGTIQSGWLPGHPTMYLKREIYDRYGAYDTDYRIAADYEFMVRFLKDRSVRLSYIPRVLIRMPYGGTSNNNASAYLTSTKEAYLALKKNGVKPAWWIILLRILRTLIQFRM